MVSSFWQKRDVGMWLFCNLHEYVIAQVKHLILHWEKRSLEDSGGSTGSYWVILSSSPTWVPLGSNCHPLPFSFRLTGSNRLTCTSDTSADPQTLRLCRTMRVFCGWNLWVPHQWRSPCWWMIRWQGLKPGLCQKCHNGSLVEGEVTNPRAKRFVWSGKCVTVCTRERYYITQLNGNQLAMFVPF